MTAEAWFCAPISTAAPLGPIRSRAVSSMFIDAAARLERLAERFGWGGKLRLVLRDEGASLGESHVLAVGRCAFGECPGCRAWPGDRHDTDCALVLTSGKNIADSHAILAAGDYVGRWTDSELGFVLECKDVLIGVARRADAHTLTLDALYATIARLRTLAWPIACNCGAPLTASACHRGGDRTALCLRCGHATSHGFCPRCEPDRWRSATGGTECQPEAAPITPAEKFDDGAAAPSWKGAWGENLGDAVREVDSSTDTTAHDRSTGSIPVGTCTVSPCTPKTTRGAFLEVADQLAKLAARVSARRRSMDQAIGFGVKTPTARVDLGPTHFYDAGAYAFGACTECCCWPGERHDLTQGKDCPGDPEAPEGKGALFLGDWTEADLPALDRLQKHIYVLAGNADLTLDELFVAADMLRREGGA